MATDIRISELNELAVNNDLNQIIINDRENAGDDGITKKIQINNLLTPDIVKTGNIEDGAVTSNKIADNTITSDNIACNTITDASITNCGISNSSLDTNSVDNRVLNNACDFTVNKISTDCLIVGAPGCSETICLNGVGYDFPDQAGNPNRFLKNDGTGILSWEEAVPGNGTALVFSDIVPVGTIIPWAGDALPADGKWLECDGTVFNGTEFPELSSVLGDTWGDPVDDNYYLPDLRGRAAVGVGVGNDENNSNKNFCLGDACGEYSTKLIYNQMPAHRHISPLSVNKSVSCQWRWGSYVTSSGAGTNDFDRDNCNYGFTTYAGGASQEDGPTTTPSEAEPHNNIQPYAATRYIIKAKPDDIQQFDMGVGPGLSALDASGGQTANINLSSSEIGLKVTDDFQFDSFARLKISDNWVEENLDQGKPLQYVNNHINTTHRYYKTSDVDLHVTQLDTAITLKDANSKVYITAMITAESLTHNGVWKLFRKVNETEIEIGSNVSTGGSHRRGIATGMYDGDDASTPNNVYIQYMDTPGSTAAEYIFKWNSDGTGNNLFTLNGARGDGTSKLYEQASSNVNLVEIGG